MAIPASRIALALKGNRGDQAPATLGSPSDRGPTQVPPIPKTGSQRMGALVKKKPAKAYG